MSKARLFLRLRLFCYLPRYKKERSLYTLESCVLRTWVEPPLCKESFYTRGNRKATTMNMLEEKEEKVRNKLPNKGEMNSFIFGKRCVEPTRKKDVYHAGEKNKSRRVKEKLHRSVHSTLFSLFSFSLSLALTSHFQHIKNALLTTIQRGLHLYGDRWGGRLFLLLLPEQQQTVADFCFSTGFGEQFWATWFFWEFFQRKLTEFELIFSRKMGMKDRRNFFCNVWKSRSINLRSFFGGNYYVKHCGETKNFFFAKIGIVNNACKIAGVRSGRICNALSGGEKHKQQEVKQDKQTFFCLQ